MFSKNRKKKESDSPTQLSNPTDSIENQSLPSLPGKNKPKSLNIKKKVSPVKKIKDKSKVQPKKEKSTKKTSSLFSKLSPLTHNKKNKDSAISIETQTSETDNSIQRNDNIASKDSSSKNKPKSKSPLKLYTNESSENSPSGRPRLPSLQSTMDIESPTKEKAEKKSLLKRKLKKKGNNTSLENSPSDKSRSQSVESTKSIDYIKSLPKEKTEKNSFLKHKIKKKGNNAILEISPSDKSRSQSVESTRGIDDITSLPKENTEKKSLRKLKKKENNASSENLKDKSVSKNAAISMAGVGVGNQESPSKEKTEKNTFLKHKIKNKDSSSGYLLKYKSKLQNDVSSTDNNDKESPTKKKTDKRALLKRKIKKEDTNYSSKNLLNNKSKSESDVSTTNNNDKESPSKKKTERRSFLKREIKKEATKDSLENLLNDKSKSESDASTTNNNDKESPSKKKTGSKPEKISFFRRKIKKKENIDSLKNISNLKQSNQDIVYKDSVWKGRPNRNNYTKLEDSSGSENELRSKRSIHLPKLQPNEAEFLQLVTDDKLDSVQSLLKNNPKMNINCINFQGVSALHLAVQNRSEAMVEFLLHQPDIDIGDTILHAVRDNNLKILVMLLDAQKKMSPGLEFAGATHSADFPDHVTPLILAAQEGHYEAVALLVSRGHTIVRPHPPNCPCIDCKNSLASDDPLDISSARLSIYRAISSPAYLVHVSSDPILSAFRLTSELAANAGAYRQLAAAYLQLRDDVSAFAVDLMGCCRTSEEVEIILKHSSGSRGRRHFILPRLLMAVDYKQKAFVAHPNTQQVLESYWCGNWYSWRSKSSLMKTLIVLSRVFITPVILVMCMVVPRCRLVKHWQIPLNKLITHAASYFVFLAIIFYISNQDKTEVTRGAPKTGAEPVLVLYVCGYIWSAVRLCVMQGPKRYFTELWNWGEIIMLLLFFMTFILWLAAAVDVQKHDKEYLERKFWNQYDPTLMAEGTFCLATIIAYFRLMFLCQLNYHLGPLQVSLGKMTVDIYKYITVFAIIICSFAAGLARFYQYYDGMVYQDEFGMKTVQVSSFTSLRDTFNTLFWALFCMSPLESADVIIENTKDPQHPNQELETKHAFTERVGYFCFACFEVISVIVVLNMLIATMSNTFQRVTDNVAIEWTFGRTEVYVDYMSQTTLPSPYNLIPTAAGMSNIVEWFGAIIKRPKGVYARWSLSYCCYIERDVEAAVKDEYPTLISILVQRYFRDKESGLVGDTAIEGELEALRREIVTLKTIIEKRYSK